MLRTKRLILTFDAFGTLFTPREPIAKSYADTARKFGLSGFTDDEIASAFRDAFTCQSRNAPNYGRKVGLNAGQWWSNVWYPLCLSMDSTMYYDFATYTPYLLYLVYQYPQQSLIHVYHCSLRLSCFLFEVYTLTSRWTSVRSSIQHFAPSHGPQPYQGS